MADFVFLNADGTTGNLASYKLRLATSGESIETVRDNARVYDAGPHGTAMGATAPGVNVPRTSPPPTYACILSGTPTGNYSAYVRYLLVRSLGGFLAIAPAAAGTVAHEQRAVDYTYNTTTSMWDTTITDSTEESRTGVAGPTGPAGPAGAGFVAKLAQNAVLAGEVPTRNITTESGFEAVGEADARMLNLNVCAPLFRIEGNPPTFRIGNCGDLRSLSSSTADNAAAITKVAATDANFSTGGLGTAFAAASVLTFIGIVTLPRTVAAGNGFDTTPVSFATLTTVEETIFPKTEGAVSNNVYVVFVRPATGQNIRGTSTNWYIAGYSSANASADLALGGITYERRSMLVSSAVGFAFARGGAGTANNIVLQTRSDTFTLPA